MSLLPGDLIRPQQRLYVVAKSFRHPEHGPEVLASRSSDKVRALGNRPLPRMPLVVRTGGHQKEAAPKRPLPCRSGRQPQGHVPEARIDAQVLPDSGHRPSPNEPIGRRRPPRNTAAQDGISTSLAYSFLAMKPLKATPNIHSRQRAPVNANVFSGL